VLLLPLETLGILVLPWNLENLALLVNLALLDILVLL
jgi:hypothetical protein